MPEGPEVTIMTEELNKHFKDSLLKDVEIKISKFKPKNLKKFEKALPLKIKQIKNKGKFVYMILSDGWALGFTPGMTGHFWVPNVSKEFRTTEGFGYNPKHDHIILKTSNGNFYFNDPRRFGHFYIYNGDELENKLKTLGPDLIKKLPKMSQVDFNEHLAKFRPNKVLADALLEQKFISGVGNYIRSDAIYLAKISPLRTIGSLSGDEKRRLKSALEKVGLESFRAQKKKGFYEFKIYGDPDAEKTKRRGRMIWWSPNKQK